MHVWLTDCLTLWDALDCSPPGSSVHGIFHARILEWVAISSSKGSSRPRDLNPRLLHWQADSPPLSHVVRFSPSLSLNPDEIHQLVLSKESVHQGLSEGASATCWLGVVWQVCFTQTKGDGLKLPKWNLRNQGGREVFRPGASLFKLWSSGQHAALASLEAWWKRRFRLYCNEFLHHRHRKQTYGYQRGRGRVKEESESNMHTLKQSNEQGPNAERRELYPVFCNNL